MGEKASHMCGVVSVHYHPFLTHCCRVVNAALGAGMLNFPFAFLKAGGILASLGLQQHSQ